MADDLGAGGLGPGQQPLMIFGGMERGMGGIDDAAEIAVAADLAPLILPRHDEDLDLQPLGLICG